MDGVGVFWADTYDERRKPWIPLHGALLSAATEMVRGWVWGVLRREGYVCCCRLRTKKVLPLGKKG